MKAGLRVAMYCLVWVWRGKVQYCPAERGRAGRWLRYMPFSGVSCVTQGRADVRVRYKGAPSDPVAPRPRRQGIAMHSKV